MKKVLIFLVFVVLLATQFLWVTMLPPGVSHDEIEYSLSSKTYALFGEDLSGTPFPLSLLQTGTLGEISPIAPLLLSPLWMIFPLSHETVRIPYVILTCIISGLVGYFAYLLFKKKSVAYLAAILFLINPWAYFLSHFAVETSFALFFYLLGIILLLRVHGYKLLFAFLAFVLGFFSYHGAKLLFLPIILICLVYRMQQKKEEKAPLHDEITFAIAMVLFLCIYALENLLISSSIITGRADDIIFLNSELLTKYVNEFRTQSILSPFSSLFINKGTESLRLMAQNYFVVISPLHLFITGDPRAVLSYHYHGLFYWYECVFIVFAIFSLARKNRITFFSLLALILIVPLPSAVSAQSEAIITRSFMLLPLLIVLCAYGMFVFYKLMPKAVYKKAFAVILIGIMSFGYFNFLYFYFFRLPILGQENFYTSQRALAKYVSFETAQGFPVIVIDDSPREVYLETIFYSDPQKKTSLLTKQKEEFLKGNYTIDSATFTNVCPQKAAPTVTYIVSTTRKSCLSKAKASYYIFDRADSGHIYKVINGNLCRGVEMMPWKNNHTFSDFAIEQMDEVTFCDRWLITSEQHEEPENPLK
ncbi:MAG: hypothetical protein AAB553_00210 [Patescibacteria group bacterium]